MVLSYCVRFCILVGFLVVGANGYTRPVDPDEKLGDIRVEVPDLSGVDKEILEKIDLDKDLRLTFDIGGSRNKLVPGETYEVAAGKGCLLIQFSNSAFNYSYELKKCGIEIPEKQLVEIRLAAFQVQWQTDKVLVDVGPVPTIEISVNGETQKPFEELYSQTTQHQNNLYIVPSDSYAFAYEKATPLRDQAKVFNLSPE